MAIVLECVEGPPKGKRLELIPGKPMSMKVRKHDQDAGAVVVEIHDAQCVVTNRSELPCLVNGQPRARSVLVNGDTLAVGKSVFAVRIDDADAGATQALDRIELDAPEPPPACSVCDGAFEARGGWSEGDRRICRRCLEKGVRPDHLPRPMSPTAESAPTRAFGNAAEAAGAPPAPAGRDSGQAHNTADRHAKRISASRLSAIESDDDKQASGLLKKVSTMLGGGRADRQRLDQLEHERQLLLVEAGRLSLGAGGGLGMPETALVALLSGRRVTLEPQEVSWSVLDQWRSQRERVLVLDTEIAALRRALGLGADHGSILLPPPSLRPEVKQQRERAFHTLDGITTEELADDAAAEEPPTSPTSPAPPPAPVRHASSSGRRPPPRRRR